MAIVECSLQCNDSAGSPGTLISCGLTNIFVNQEIRVRFSSEIEPASISNNTFQMTESGTGKTPAGTFAIDPSDPRTLIYRPQVTFDSAGNPIFGLTQDKTYFFKVPGSLLDPSPYIRSRTGAANSTRLQCRLVASEGVRDLNPGRPRSKITVQVADDTGTGPILGPDGIPVFFTAAGETEVFLRSPVHIEFDDVMNPATLANPVSGVSSFIRAFVDADGETTDRSDQVPILGSFAVTIDQNASKTIVVFTPSGGFPSRGDPARRDCKGLPADECGRKIVIELSPQIADLGGNAIINPGTIAFTTQLDTFEIVSIVEPFLDPSREDPVRTGSLWGADLLSSGPGGGSGRLGDLVVLPGVTVLLDTDSEDFSGITNPVIFNPRNVIDPPEPFTIPDGVFEFSRLRVDAGGVLRFKGSHPARIYVRGVADIQGLIDVSGANGTIHQSNSGPGGLGGTSGPSGGAGGRGGNRPDGAAFMGDFLGTPIGGEANPGIGPEDVLDPVTYTHVNGVDGGGIPYPSAIAPAPIFVSGGKGGLAWPQPTALNPALHMPQNVEDVSGLEPDLYQECRFPVPASPGSGGAYALDGGIGDGTYIPLTPVTLPLDTLGGDSGELQIDDLVRSLSPEMGLLRGGGGGGGGGAHLQRTQVNGKLLTDCSVAVPSGNALQVVSYEAHSSAGGGGGGGALQVAAGRRIILNGVLDASGGTGGSGTFPPDPETPSDLAQAGGGGAGGAVLLQSQRIQIQAVPGRINVAGGDGGEGSGSVFPIIPAKGGFGSPGFVRIETPVPALIENEKAKILPTETTLMRDFGASIDAIFTTAEWHPTENPPSGWSGAESCWIRPSGSFFRLFFEEDGAELGWDMRLRIAGYASPQSFRGPNDVLPGMTLEEAFSTTFGEAPVLVRFQGARALGVLIDPCAVPELGGSSPLSAPSISFWKPSPTDLNLLPDESLSPNIFRFQILWDRSQVVLDGVGNPIEILGLEDLTVRIQPD